MYNFIGTEWSYILCSLQTIRIMTFASYEGVQEGEILYIWIHFPLSFTGCMPLGFFCMWQDNFSLHVFPCFPSGGKRRKYGWDGHPLVQPSQQSLKSFPAQQTGNPGMRPAHASPGRLLQLQCCSLSVQEGPNTSWCIITVIRHFSAHCRGQIWKGTKAS